MTNKQDQSGRDRSKKKSFWELFTLTENGHLKSTALMYAFALSFLYIGIYVLAYMLLLGPLNVVLAPRFSVGVVNFLESVLPSLLATAVCMVPFFFIREKRIVPMAYAFILLYAVVVLIVILMGAEKDDPLLSVYLLFVPAPAIIGCTVSAVSYILYARRSR